MTDLGLILNRFGIKGKLHIDFFIISAPPFNTLIRAQKKLFGIMRFSEGLKIEISGAFFRPFARFLEI